MLFMMVNKSDLVETLVSLGLGEKEAAAYLTLLRQGELTPLELSRETKINRTTLYRVLEELEERGLVKKALGYKTTSYQASPPEAIRAMLSQREAELGELQEAVGPLITQLTQLQEEQVSPTKVFYYHGRQGLRQLLWNTLSAKDEVVGLGYADWNAGVGRRFAEKIRAEYVSRGLRGRELLNEGFIDKKFSFTDNREYVKKYYEHRVIPKKTMVINYDTYIYNDVFAFYHIFQGELFGVEIHNAEIARTEKQIFEILWKMAKKVI